jgi:hypothetical protein
MNGQDISNIDSITVDTVNSRSNGPVTFTDDICISAGNVLQVDTLQTKSNGPLTLSNDLCIDSANLLAVDTIESKSNGPLTFTDDVTVQAGNVLNAPTTNIDTINALTTSGAITISDDLCIDAANTLQVDTIESKTPANPVNINDDLTTTGNISSGGNITIGFLAGNGTTPIRIDNNGTIILGNAQTQTSNIVCATIRVETPLIQSKDANPLNVGSNMDLFCNDISNVEALTVDTVNSKSNGPVTFTDDITVQAGNVLNTNTLNSTTMDGTITINDDVTIASDETLTVDTIDTTSGTLTILDNVDMNCMELGNVDELVVSNISSKGLDLGNLANVVQFTSPAIVGFSTSGGGVKNQFWGYNNGLNISTGTDNTTMGYNAAANITVGSQNVIMGSNALPYSNFVNNTVAIGFEAAKDHASSLGETTNFIAIGSQALGDVTTGASNTVAIGYKAGNNATGDFNVMIGSNSGDKITGRENVFLGSTVFGSTNTLSGNSNVGIGPGALSYMTTGNQNIGIGIATGAILTTGSNNIIMGNNMTASLLSTGSNNIVFGSSAQAAATVDNQIVIGFGATSTSEDDIIFGRPETTVGLSATATAEAWGQVFQNRAWDDGNESLACIDGAGNIVKAGAGSDCAVQGNIDMFCNDISNVAALEVNTLNAKEDGNISIEANTIVNGDLTVNGCLRYTVMGYTRVEVTGTYTVLEGDDIIAANTQVGAITITLPAISSLVECSGQMTFAIVDEGGEALNNNITINANVADTILGGSSIVLSGNYNAIHIYSDGTDGWFMY